MNTRLSSNSLIFVGVAFTAIVVLSLVAAGFVAADNHRTPVPENETDTEYRTQLITKDAGFGVLETLFLDSGDILLAGPAGEEFGDTGVGRVNSGPELRKYNPSGELIWRTDISLHSGMRESIISLEQTSSGRFVAVMSQRSRHLSDDPKSAYIVRVVEVTQDGKISRSRTVQDLNGTEFGGVSAHFRDATITDDGTVVAVGSRFVGPSDSRGLVVFSYPNNETEYHIIDRAAEDRIQTVRATGSGDLVGLYTQRGPNWPQADVAHYRAWFSPDNFETEPLPELDRRYGNGTDRTTESAILSRYRNDVGKNYIFDTHNKITRNDETTGFIILNERFRPVQGLTFPSYAEPRDEYNVTRSNVYRVKSSKKDTYLVAGRTTWYEDYNHNLDSRGENYRQGWVVEVDFSESSITTTPVVNEPHLTITGIKPAGEDRYTLVATYEDPEIPEGVQMRIYQATPERETTPTSTVINTSKNTATESTSKDENTGTTGEEGSGFTVGLAFVALATAIIIVLRLR